VSAITARLRHGVIEITGPEGRIVTRHDWAKRLTTIKLLPADAADLIDAIQAEVDGSRREAERDAQARFADKELGRDRPP
jgi:hypothetical protein